MKKLKNYLNLFNFTLLLSACTVSVPNTKVCTVSGFMAAGADCVWTLSDEVQFMTLDEFIQFLEPREEHVDPNDPSKIIPAYEGAICQTGQDWGKQKTALEQACEKLGTSCSYEMKKKLHQVSSRVDNLTRNALFKSRLRPKKQGEKK